jgi:hypothetical protein
VWAPPRCLARMLRTFFRSGGWGGEPGEAFTFVGVERTPSGHREASVSISDHTAALGESGNRVLPYPAP